jgi:hypothetical protein
MTEHVPTAPELVALGLAHEESETRKLGNGQKRTTTWIVVHDEGHRLMGEVMHRNAQAALARGEGDWVRPPSRDIPGLRNRDT